MSRASVFGLGYLHPTANSLQVMCLSCMDKQGEHSIRDLKVIGWSPVIDQKLASSGKCLCCQTSLLSAYLDRCHTKTPPGKYVDSLLDALHEQWTRLSVIVRSSPIEDLNLAMKSQLDIEARISEFSVTT